jgi:hypothetical protein
MKICGMRILPILVGALVIMPFHAMTESTDERQSERPAWQNETQKKDGLTGSGEEGKSSFSFFAYKPPKRGTPGGRIGGGSRGTPGKSFTLSVLAPDHTGLTTMTQPALYWYFSGASGGQIECLITVDEEGKPFAQKSLQMAPARGIKRIRLSDLGVVLSPGREYTWFISLIVDSAQPSKEIFSSGAIRLERISHTFRKRLAGAKQTELPAILAENGIWYDALDALSAMIDENPEMRALREQRARLLDEVGLHEVARFDRER